MKIVDTLRKTGVFRAGATSGTYTNAADRPAELQMDGVFNAEKDLVANKTTEKSDPVSEQPSQSTQPAVGNSVKPPATKWKKIALYAVGGLAAFVALALVFGAPSAESVFKDSLDTMLQTKSVTVKQEFKGGGGEIGSIDMESTNFMDLTSKDLSAKGKFSIDIVTNEVPVTVAGDYIALDDDRYVKIEKLDSNDSTYSEVFAEAGSKLEGKWLVARDEDSFSTIATTPVDAITKITALPFANLGDDIRKEVVAILNEEKSFTIVESSKVTVDGVDAYRYELEYDEDNQAKVSKKISEATGYLTVGDEESDMKVTKLEVWINIKTKQFIKMEYSGTSNDGDLNAVVTFSDYDKKQSVEKPADYYIESELLD